MTFCKFQFHEFLQRNLDKMRKMDLQRLEGLQPVGAGRQDKYQGSPPHVLGRLCLHWAHPWERADWHSGPHRDVATPLARPWPWLSIGSESPNPSGGHDP